MEFSLYTEWRKTKCPITGLVCGNTGNTTKHIAIGCTRPNSRHKSAQTFENLAPLRIYTVSHSGLLAAIRPESPVTRRDMTPLSTDQHVQEATPQASTHTYMYVIQSYEQCSLSSSCQTTMHTCVRTHKCPSSSQKFPVLVFSAWGCVFFFVCRNSCLHSPFSPNRGKENKNIMKGLKEITGCQSSETQSVSVCVMCVCFYRVKRVCVCLFACKCTGVACRCTCVRDENLTKPPFFCLSSPHHRGMDTKGLSTIIQSKQHVSEKWFYKNTVYDTCVRWVLML